MKDGFQVILCNGKFTKNIKGRKTDVQDCQWIQKLHTIGLLTGSFLPDEQTEHLRTYCRHRADLIDQSADLTRKMQKCLRLLNLRLDIVVKDIVGLTGLQIIKSICSGEVDPATLASLRHGNCKKSEEEIAKALQSNKRADYTFALQQALKQYDFLQSQITDCDNQIEKMLATMISNDDNKKEHTIDKKVHKRVNKNTPKNMDLNLLAYQYFEGVDLLAIEGFSYSTVLTLMSEVGNGIHKFETAKQFASWLRLAPNNKVSGGKTLSNKIPKGSGRLKIAFRNAANAIGNLKDTALSNFFARISHRKGRVTAISATARKLAIIVWNMIVKNQPYKPMTEYQFVDQKRKKITAMKKIIAKFEITDEDLNLAKSTC
jgi:transposase